MSGENPCNICHADCSKALGSDEWGDNACMFYQRYNEAYVCEAYDCFINYEGSCALNLYDDCGCRKYFEGETT